MTRGPRPRSSPSDFRVWRSPRLRLTPRHIEFRRDLRWSHATAVAHFPTQSIRSTGLHLVRWNGSHIELHRLHSEWLHSEQSCFCQKNGKLVVLPTPAPCKLDPSVRVLPSLRSTLTEGALLDYTPRPRTRVSPLFCPTHGKPATMLAFFPNKSRPARSGCGYSVRRILSALRAVAPMDASTTWVS
jgi:hypothetical protein